MITKKKNKKSILCSFGFHDWKILFGFGRYNEVICIRCLKITVKEDPLYGR
jgi:hypothetical protein